MDACDWIIVNKLMLQGRTTWAELGALTGLSSPAVAERVRKLEEAKVITGYFAQVNPQAVGCGLAAFIAVTLERPAHRQAFLQLVQDRPEIQECHHVAGDEDYVLKVRCADTQHLEYFLSEVVKGMDGVVKTRTTIILSTVKETSVLPLSQDRG